MNRYIKQHDKALCCGCGACVAACPRDCIIMKEDDEGFLYPEIDDLSRCINCGKCSRVCPIETRPTASDKATSDFYGGYTSNANYINRSSSGGIFSEIATNFIKQGGLVCGAAINEQHKIHHTIIDKLENLYLLQGSKYVQSDLASCLEEIGSNLKAGHKLLFTGTPCQVAALKKSFKSEHLYTLDVLCHGVPSQKLFNTYIEFLEKKHKGTLTEIAFRDKERNGWSITQRYKIRKGHKEKTYYLDRHLSEYFSGFLRNMTQRESCYQCPYTTIERVGDITLADFWGVDRVRPELHNRAGTSLILSNSRKGDEMIHQLSRDVVLAPVTQKEALVQNINFLSPPERHPHRDCIYKEIYEKGFELVGKTKILPPNAYKYRIWAVLQDMRILGSLWDRRAK